MLHLLRFVGYTGIVLFVFSEIVDPTSDSEWAWTGFAALLTAFVPLIVYQK